MRNLLFLSFIIYNSTPIISAQGVWTQKADFGGTARCAAVGFSIGTKGYVGTGYDSSGIYKKDFWEWDQASNLWTQKADFGGTPRENAVGFSIGTKGYLGTGDSAGFPYKDFWEWDQVTNIWSQKSDFGGGATYSGIGFSSAAKGYIGTGQYYNTGKEFWEWNQLTDIWAQKAGYPHPLLEAVCFSIGSKGYLGTGQDHMQVFKDFWEWDETTNAWTQKADFGGISRSAATGFSIGTKGYIGTGYPSYKDFWEWDQATNVWTQKADFGGTGRYYSVGFSIGSKGYIGIGNDPTNYKKDFWEFDPNGNGVNEIELEKLIEVYPSPSVDGKLQVTSCKLQIKEIKVYNLQGENVFQSATCNLQPKINLCSQPNGVYFIHLTTDKGNATKRIILSH